MVDNDDKIIKRRGLLRSFARFGVLAGIGGLAVFGEAKRRRLLREGECVGRGVCGGCGVFADCGLPLAAAAKQSRLEASGTGQSRQDASGTIGGGDER